MKKIIMTRKQVKEEHDRLIPVLMRGSKKRRMSEAKKQREEMKEYGIKAKKRRK